MTLDKYKKKLAQVSQIRHIRLIHYYDIKTKSFPIYPLFSHAHIKSFTQLKWETKNFYMCFLFIRISETAILIINLGMLTNLTQYNIRVTGKWLVYQS